jgi:hypothetical protein
MTTPRFPRFPTQPAYELIGHEGVFRLPGGRTLYEAVLYNIAGQGVRPRLARLDTSRGLHQVNRYVDWDQPVEVIRDYSAEYDAAKEAEYEAED